MMTNDEKKRLPSQNDKSNSFIRGFYAFFSFLVCHAIFGFIIFLITQQTIAPFLVDYKSHTGTFLIGLIFLLWVGFLFFSATPALFSSLYFGYRVGSNGWVSWKEAIAVALLTGVYPLVLGLAFTDLSQTTYSDHPFRIIATGLDAAIIIYGAYAVSMLLTVIVWRKLLSNADLLRFSKPKWRLKNVIAVFSIGCFAVLTPFAAFRLGADVEKSNKLFVRSIDANERYITLSLYYSADDARIFIYDLKEKNSFIFQSKNKKFLHPRLSRIDSNTIFFTEVEPDKPPTMNDPDYEVGLRTLIKCRILETQCERVFSLKKSISEVLEIPEEGLLFVSSSLVPRKNSTNTFILAPWKWDLYLRGKEGEIRRLTNFESLVHSVSILENMIVFNGRFSKKSPIAELLPKDYKKYKSSGSSGSSGSSEIHRIKYDGSVKNMKIEKSVFRPFIKVGNDLDVRPSAIKGSPFVSFLSAEGEKGGWRYNAIVYDYKQNKVHDVIRAKRKLSMYKPSMVSPNKMIYMESYDGAYHIRSYSIEEKKIHEIAKVDVEDVRNMKATAIDIGGAEPLSHQN